MVSSIGGFLQPPQLPSAAILQEEQLPSYSFTPTNLLFKKSSFKIEKGNSGNPEKQLIMIFLNLYIYFFLKVF